MVIMREEIVIPAIIAKSHDEFEDKINKVKNHFELIQLDFMDGKFVPNNSIDFDFNIPDSNCKYEAHLMVKNPEKWIEQNHHKIDMILFHYESTDKHSEIIRLTKEKSKKIGIVLNPETPISKISTLIDEIDQVLIMTVNPGFYGSPFLPDMVEKIKELRKIKPDLDIEVDGGITDKTIGLVKNAGANMFVSGSYLVKSDDIINAKNNLIEILG
jgi:ribulose-phosphate 3-epimerase